MVNFISQTDQFVDLLWLIAGFPGLLGLGLYFTLRSRGMQVRRLGRIFKLFRCYLSGDSQTECRGLPPLQMFMAAIGGCIGIGNVVGVCTAVQIGGPGALFWVWLTALVGMIIKYVEVFLGMRFRQHSPEGGYDGGPVYYLQKAFRSKLFAGIAAVLLCVYGVEVFIFNTMVNVVVINWGFNQTLAVGALLSMVVAGVSGGMGRIGRIAGVIVPFFVLAFLIMCGWVLVQNVSLIPSMIGTVFSSAFQGHAAIGGFAGSGIMLAVSQGVSWGCYSGDIGVGYASVIHTESSEVVPQKQASLAILGVFLDTLVICTLSLSVIMLTGVWTQEIPAVLLVQTALGMYLPAVDLFVPALFLLLGYSTVIAFFGVGLKSAAFLGGRRGQRLYMAYGIIALVIFSYADPTTPAVLMRAAGCLLLMLNLCAFFRLRKEVSFDLSVLHLDPADERQTVEVPIPA